MFELNSGELLPARTTSALHWKQTYRRRPPLPCSEFGEPITLFGEGPADRRDRLKRLLSKMEVEGVDVSSIAMPSSAGPSLHPNHNPYFLMRFVLTLTSSSVFF